MTDLLAIGDVHGHLQAALCVAARWQRELGIAWDAVLLAGDVGAFTDESQLDEATLRHGDKEVLELEFLHLWATDPPMPWLRAIFEPVARGGLGLTCPVVMVHGNHEGFAHLATLVPAIIPTEPVPAAELPGVDPKGRIRYLPSGWRCVTPAGVVVGGVGGVEWRQRRTQYHPLAYIDEAAVQTLLAAGPVDILLTHQGPAVVQGPAGAPSLDPLAEVGAARLWFHGHGAIVDAPTPVGPGGRTVVVPLGGIPFAEHGGKRLGEYGWARVHLGEEAMFDREPPPFLREYDRFRWITLPSGHVAAPDLVRFALMGS